MIGEVLRFCGVKAVVAHGQEQIAIGALRDAAAEVIAGRQGPLLPEDHFDIGEPWCACRDELSARQ
jgi:hypothetical protein